MKRVAAAIIRDKNKILIARRANIENLVGFWEFPGGKVEEGETLQECLERELKEELGIVIKSGHELISSIYKYEHGSFKIIALDARIISGEVKLRVHDKVRWLLTEEIIEVGLLPADIEIARYLQKVQKD